MCLGDFRRGRLLHSNTRVVAIPTAGAILCTVSPRRVAVEFACPAAVAIPVAVGGIPAAGVGSPIGDGLPPLRYSSLDFGDAPTRQFSAGPTAAGGSIQVTELLMDDAVLAANPN